MMRIKEREPSTTDLGPKKDAETHIVETMKPTADRAEQYAMWALQIVGSLFVVAGLLHPA